eukprot:gnl/MRDRNA2_/MRDRNA2_96772_c0_seq1.p1 gnl/MRDRNA2_/MRDRNA2_96772_c0~~gnl/MRDRNA2_/MRDRNA2_96772_c0_seq1.p1  ORF type:complete len:321 (+),score=65.01 gnl/MRDRNA2_/MRDRNA2_96772_c0_seq1:98-1060(+)
MELHGCEAVAALQVERPWYVFDLSDDANWLKHLRDHGFVVLRGVASGDQVCNAKGLLWDAICERFGDTKRDDPDTWNNFRLGQAGIVPWLAQSAGAWAVRGWPGVKQAFARIWETEDLIVSMDSVLLWRPWWVQSEWRPSTEGLHLDQNPFNKVALECIQGMVPLLPVTDHSGGLQVVPDSHLDKEKSEFKKRHLHMRSSGDWCPCDDEDLKQRAILLHAAPGDLVLWDARTVHGGLVGTGQCRDETTAAELARLSVTVSMTPRAWAGELVLEQRRKGFNRGESFNHVPHESGSSNGTVRAPVRRDFQPPVLTDAQRALL